MNHHDEDGDIEMVDLDSPEEIAQVNQAVFDAREKEAAAAGTGGGSVVETWSYDTHNGTSRVFIIDTNFIIAHLSVVEWLRKHEGGILIPWVVVQELDGLSKQHQTAENVSLHAKRAIHWIHLHINKGTVFGQSIFQQVTGAEYGDDAILDCCLYYRNNLQCQVVLLTNDKNLVIKAKIHGVDCESYHAGMTGDYLMNKYPVHTTQEPQQQEMMMMDIEEPKIKVVHDLYSFLDDVERILIGVFMRLVQLHKTKQQSFMSPKEFQAKQGSAGAGASITNADSLEKIVQYLPLHSKRFEKEIATQVKRFNHLYQAARMRNEFAQTTTGGKGDRLFEPTKNYQKSLHLSSQGRKDVWTCIKFWIELWEFMYNDIQQQQEEIYVRIQSTQLPLKVGLADAQRAEQVWKTILSKL